MKEVTSPAKYPLNSPKGAAAAATETAGTKYPPTSPAPSKSQPPSVFTFTPQNQSTPTRNHTHNTASTHAAYHAQKPTYSNSIAGASAHFETPHQVSAVSAEKQSHTDPNLQLNYKAKVYLTESQREAYGGNILTRMPSIDGSKIKFLVGGDRDGRSRPGSYSSDSLPRGMTYHRRQDVQREKDMVQLDTELGCSQC